MLEARDGVSPSLTREANSSLATQQVSFIWWRDCVKGHREKSYFGKDSGSGVGTGIGIQN